MTRALALQAGFGVALIAGGAWALARPGVLRPAADGEPRYALRIAGMMLVAAGIMGLGFAIALQLAGGA